MKEFDLHHAVKWIEKKFENHTAEVTSVYFSRKDPAYPALMALMAMVGEPSDRARPGGHYYYLWDDTVVVVPTAMQDGVYIRRSFLTKCRKFGLLPPCSNTVATNGDDHDGSVPLPRD